MELQDKEAFNESIAFSAGSAHATRKIRDIIIKRLTVLKALKYTNVKQELVRNVCGELERLLETIDKD